MIPMTVAIDDVTNGLTGEPLLKLALKPFRKLCAERIYKDDAFGRDQKKAVPCAIPGAIHIVRYLDDVARRPALCGCRQRAE